MSIADRRASTRDLGLGAENTGSDDFSNSSLRKISSRISSRAFERRQSMWDHSPSAASSACFLLRYCVKDRSSLIVDTLGLWHLQLYPSYWTFQAWLEMQPWSPSQVHYHLSYLPLHPQHHRGSCPPRPTGCHFVYHCNGTLEDHECCMLYEDLRGKCHATRNFVSSVTRNQPSETDVFTWEGIGLGARGSLKIAFMILWCITVQMLLTDPMRAWNYFNHGPYVIN